MAGLPLLAIEPDLGSGASRAIDGKLDAAHFSASLAVNSFARGAPPPVLEGKKPFAPAQRKRALCKRRSHPITPIFCGQKAFDTSTATWSWVSLPSLNASRASSTEKVGMMPLFSSTRPCQVR
jgi:hypothetical protein